MAISDLGDSSSRHWRSTATQSAACHLLIFVTMVKEGISPVPSKSLPEAGMIQSWRKPCPQSETIVRTNDGDDSINVESAITRVALQYMVETAMTGWMDVNQE